MTRKKIFAALTIVAVFGIAILVGCEKQTTVKSSPGEGLQIETPKTKVEIGGGKGVQIDTPNTKVEIGGGNGVQVETPNTDVNVESEKK